MRKIVAAGAGELAAAILTRLAATNPGELVVLDGDRSRADANALDVATAAATGVRHSRARGTDDWHDASGCEVARSHLAIPCSGSRLWYYRSFFDEATRARAGTGAYIVVRDTTCRLFGYHGLLGGDCAFSLDHMFGF